MGSSIKGKKETLEEARLRLRIAELEARAAELEALEKKHKMTEKLMEAECAVTTILAKTNSPQLSTTKVLQAICECFKWNLGAFWTVDQANLLYFSGSWLKPSASAERFEQASKQYIFRPGFGLPGYILSKRKPSWFPNYAADLIFPRAPVAAKEGLHSAGGFPILLGNKIIGIMEFFCFEKQESANELLQFMGEIGSRIGDCGWDRWHESSKPLMHKTGSNYRR